MGQQGRLAGGFSDLPDRHGKTGGQGLEMGADATCWQNARQGQRDIADRMKKFRQGHIGWIDR